MTEDTSSWQSAASAAEECQYLNRIYYKEDFKVIFFWLSGVKKWMEICAIEGGGTDAMANAILKFQFFWNIPLSCHITDNVLNVYSVIRTLLCVLKFGSQRIDFLEQSKVQKHELVIQSTSLCFHFSFLDQSKMQKHNLLLQSKSSCILQGRHQTYF